MIELTLVDVTSWRQKYQHLRIYNSAHTTTIWQFQCHWRIEPEDSIRTTCVVFSHWGILPASITRPRSWQQTSLLSFDLCRVLSRTCILVSLVAVVKVRPLGYHIRLQAKPLHPEWQGLVDSSSVGNIVYIRTMLLNRDIGRNAIYI